MSDPSPDLHELGEDGIKTKLAYKIVVDNFDAEFEYITNEGKALVPVL